MEINRNQWFLVGLILLSLGIQFRMVDSYVLTSDVTQLLAEATGTPIASANAGTILQPTDGLPVKKTVVPPEWLGWVMLSVGLVLSLQSLAMKRPE